MAGVDPHPPRPPQEDVENLNQPSTTIIGSHRINLSMEFTKLEGKADYITYHPGRPSVIFNLSEKEALIKQWQHVLVAKFSHGRPTLEAIKHFFNHQKLKGDIKVAIYDSKHIIVECGQFADFVQIWIKKVWIIKGFTARFFKWNEKFHPDFESSITPVWIHLPCLPLFLYDERALLKISSAIGRPLFVDKNNINRSKLGYATICVEIDVAKPLIDQLWLRFVGKGIIGGSDGFLQKVLYDFIPHHCSHCHHLGHKFEVCKRRGVQDQGSKKQGKDKGLVTGPEQGAAVLEKGILGDVHKSLEEEVLVEDLALEEGELVESVAVSEGTGPGMSVGRNTGAAGASGGSSANMLVEDAAEQVRSRVKGKQEVFEQQEGAGQDGNGSISTSVLVPTAFSRLSQTLDIKGMSKNLDEAGMSSIKGHQQIQGMLVYQRMEQPEPEMLQNSLVLLGRSTEKVCIIEGRDLEVQSIHHAADSAAQSRQGDSKVEGDSCNQFASIKPALEQTLISPNVEDTLVAAGEDISVEDKGESSLQKGEISEFCYAKELTAFAGNNNTVSEGAGSSQQQIKQFGTALHVRMLLGKPQKRGQYSTGMKSAHAKQDLTIKAKTVVVQDDRRTSVRAASGSGEPYAHSRDDAGTIPEELGNAVDPSAGVGLNTTELVMEFPRVRHEAPQTGSAVPFLLVPAGTNSAGFLAGKIAEMQESDKASGHDFGTAAGQRPGTNCSKSGADTSQTAGLLGENCCNSGPLSEQATNVAVTAREQAARVLDSGGAIAEGDAGAVGEYDTGQIPQQLEKAQGISGEVEPLKQLHQAGNFDVGADGTVLEAATGGKMGVLPTEAESHKTFLTPRKLSSAAAEFTPKWDVQVEELVQESSHKQSTDRVQKVIAKAHAVLAEKKAQAQGDHTTLNKNAMEQLQERMNRLRGIEVPAAQRLAASTRVPSPLLSDEMKDIICPFKCKSVPNSPPRSKKQSKSLFDSQVYSPATHGNLKRYGSDTSDDTSVDFDCSWQDYDC